MDSGKVMAISLAKTFIRCYKALYLSAIVANAAALFIEVGFNFGILQIYLIDVALFSINIAAWLGYERGIAWTVELEVILSVGRMLMILLASTIVLADMVALFSPIGWVLWYKLMFKLIDQPHRASYWSGCIALFLLEAFYLYSVTHISADDSGCCADRVIKGRAGRSRGRCRYLSFHEVTVSKPIGVVAHSARITTQFLHGVGRSEFSIAMLTKRDL